MARHFLGLKIALLRSALRASRQRKVGFVLGIVFAAPFAVAGFFMLASARAHPTTGRDIAMILFAVLLFAWIVFPLLNFGSDETLDPARLSLLPLNRRQLMSGLAIASVVGIAPLGTFIALCGVVAGFAPPGAGAVLVVLGVAVEFALCIVGSRAVSTALSGALRSRRGRDISVFLMSILGAVIGLAPQVLRLTVHEIPTGTLGQAAIFLSWTPPGWVVRGISDARAGHFSSAALWLALAAALVILLAWIWWLALDRALTGVPETTRRREATDLFSGLSRWFPHTRRGAVAATELRYIWRDPRRRAAWLTMGFLVAGGAGIVAVFLREHQEIVLGAAVTALLAGLQSMNQFGFDGSAFWMNVAAGEDPRADITGKNLAVLALTLISTSLLGVALAALTGGWIFLPVAIATAVGTLGVALGVANYISVRAPIPIPESKTNVWATQGAGQGCMTGFLQVAGIWATNMLLVPIAALLIAGMTLWTPLLVISAPFSILYGYFIWRVGVHLSWEWLRGRGPEFLQTIQPQRAA